MWIRWIRIRIQKTVFYESFMQAKNRESGEIVALKRVRLDDDDEGVPSSALREICLLKVREPCINSVFRIRIRIHRIHMFLVLPDPDPSISKQNSKKNLDSYCFLTSFGFFIFEK
jgi:hypothetical protein